MTTPVNAIRAAAREGRTAYGIYVRTESAAMVDLAGAAGLDFIRIDSLHGGLGIETTVALVRAAYANSLTPTVRVPKDEYFVTACLESGAMGITFPDIENADQAREVVSWCRPAPLGHLQALRPARLTHLTQLEFRQWQVDEMVVAVQVESVTGAANVEEIVRVDSLDMIQCGRSDLAASMGAAGPAAPEVIEKERQIGDAALRAGKLLSLQFGPGGSDDEVRGWLGRGISAVTLGSETQIFSRALQDRLTSLRAGAVS